MSRWRYRKLGMLEVRRLLTRGLIFSTRVLLGLGIMLELTWAHAVIIESVPRDQERLAHAPEAVMLRFNVKIEKPFARVSLWHPQHGLTPLSIPEENFAPGVGAARLHIPLPSLEPGRYQVRYKVLSADGHTTEGIVRFVIGGFKSMPGVDDPPD